jgi:hypothetical protein
MKVSSNFDHIHRLLTLFRRRRRHKLDRLFASARSAREAHVRRDHFYEYYHAPAKFTFLPDSL